ncbi:hypothetical protein BDV11DRAFT_194264 [Aspergillus similis]
MGGAIYIALLLILSIMLISAYITLRKGRAPLVIALLCPAIVTRGNTPFYAPPTPPPGVYLSREQMPLGIRLFLSTSV